MLHGLRPGFLIEFLAIILTHQAPSLVRQTFLFLLPCESRTFARGLQKEAKPFQLFLTTAEMPSHTGRVEYRLKGLRQTRVAFDEGLEDIHGDVRIGL
jgi:hypothetical protein